MEKCIPVWFCYEVIWECREATVSTELKQLYL